jgi:hypothetical protein
MAGIPNGSNPGKPLDAAKTCPRATTESQSRPPSFFHFRLALVAFDVTFFFESIISVLFFFPRKIISLGIQLLSWFR